MPVCRVDESPDRLQSFSRIHAEAHRRFNLIVVLVNRTRSGVNLLYGDLESTCKGGYESAGSGSREMWVCDDDGSNPVQLTSFWRAQYRGATVATGWQPRRVLIDDARQSRPLCDPSARRRPTQDHRPPRARPSRRLVRRRGTDLFPVRPDEKQRDLQSAC